MLEQNIQQNDLAYRFHITACHTGVLVSAEQEYDLAQMAFKAADVARDIRMRSSEAPCTELMDDLARIVAIAESYDHRAGRRDIHCEAMRQMPIATARAFGECLGLIGKIERYCAPDHLETWKSLRTHMDEIAPSVAALRATLTEDRQKTAPVRQPGTRLVLQ